MDIKNKTTAELNVLQDRIRLELAQRETEVKSPFFYVIGHSDKNESFGSVVQQKDCINRAFVDMLVSKNKFITP